MGIHDNDGFLTERVDDLHERVSNLEREDQRTRHRLHDLEADRAAVRHLTGLATEVFEASKKMQQDALALIESVATRAVEKTLAKRMELRWKLALRVSAILGGLGGFGYLVYVITQHGKPTP